MENRKEPNLVDKARSLGTAVYNWAAKDGFHKTPPEELEKRKSICLACPQWDATAFNNVGKCKICGCSAGKWYKEDGKMVERKLIITEETMIETFFHEVVHIILDSTGELKLSQNEKFVNMMGKAWLEIYLSSVYEKDSA